MSLFSEIKPQWDAVGVDPGSTKKTAGWGANEKPPAEWFNWLFNRNYKCIDELRTVVDALAVSSGAANVIVPGVSMTGSDSYVITPTPAILAYSTGMTVVLLVDTGNTGAASINISGKGVKTIKKQNGAGKVDVSTGDMIAFGTYILVFDSTDFILMNPNLATGSYLQARLMNSAGTDLVFGNVFTGNSQLITAVGTTAFVAPKTGIYKVTVVGGGGGGGNGGTYGPSGGGGGGMSIGYVSLTKGSSYNAVVGTGGNYASGTPVTASSGGSSSFSGISASGGAGGSTGGAYQSSWGGSGGNGSGGFINVNGWQGFTSFYSSSSIWSVYEGDGRSGMGSLGYGAGGMGGSNGQSGMIIIEW